MTPSPNILETVPESEDIRSMAARELQAKARKRLGFIVLWNSDEPETVGAFLQAVADDADQTRVLGRGAERPTDEHPRLTAVRQRPKSNGSIEQTWRALGMPNRHVLNRLV